MAGNGSNIHALTPTYIVYYAHHTHMSYMFTLFLLWLHANKQNVLVLQSLGQPNMPITNCQHTFSPSTASMEYTVMYYTEMD